MQLESGRRYGAWFAKIDALRRTYCRQSLSVARSLTSLCWEWHFRINQNSLHSESFNFARFSFFQFFQKISLLSFLLQLLNPVFDVHIAALQD